MITFENIAHLFFLLGVGQGLMMALVFYKKSLAGEKFYRFLAFVLMIFSLVLLYWLGYWHNAYANSAPLHGFGFLLDPLDLLLGPAIYFFVRSKLDNSFHVRGKEWLHITPYVVLTLHGIHATIRATTGLELYRFADSQEEAFVVGAIYTAIKHAQFVLYAVWIWQLIPKSQGLLKYTFWVYLLNVAGRLIYMGLSYSSILTLDIDYVISIVIVSGIYSISYYSNLRPEFFKKKTAYEHSSLSSKHESLICNEVVLHMKNNKSYLDSGYSVSMLADELKIPRHHVSQAINMHLKKTFSSLLNEMRVKEAIDRLSDPHRKGDKILKVALESGFNNKVSFHRYFKEKTGLSPSEYRQTKLHQFAE